MKQEHLATIQNRIDYRFNNIALLEQAFTRRSYSEENGGENNEVLEFIGDKVLDLVVVKLLVTQNTNSEGLFKKFDPQFRYTWPYLTEKESLPPENVLTANYSEAEFTELKKQFVQKKTLAGRIDALGLAQYLLMGKGDILQNTGEENSVKEDLFEAILGAIAIDCNWNMEKLETAVFTMLDPESFFIQTAGDDYSNLIAQWTQQKLGCEPMYHLDQKGYSPTATDTFQGISQRPKSLDASELLKTKYTCYLQIAGNLPNFRAFGCSQSEARKNVCKIAYDYLCKEGLWLSIRDEIDKPTVEDAINQLEILARRGYFSIPTYKFEQTYDKDGNPVWESVCHIAEKSETFCAKASSKKEAKKSAAYEMLLFVLDS